MFQKPKNPKNEMKEDQTHSGSAEAPETAPAAADSKASPSSPTAAKDAAPSDSIIRELSEQIERLKTEKQELNDKYLRLGADYANFQKRVPKQVSDSVDYEKRTFLRSLLTSLDNFSHALNGAETAAANPQAMQSWIAGIRMVYQHLLDALKAQGVEKIDAMGKPFDPSVHEALTFRAEADKPNGIVLEEYQGGYTYRGQALRPSKVIVNKLPSEPTVEETTDDKDGADATGK